MADGLLGNILTGGAEYFLGKENIEGAMEAGLAGQQALEQLGERVSQEAQFKPFTVTTGLGTTATTPEGSIDIGLAPEQQALQQQLIGQATGLFGQVGVSPAEAQSALYEQMRAVQRPEEERQRLALEERLLSQGRLGLQSAAYGGASPELLAQETARQEAMARENLAARQQAMAEQQQALTAASGLLGAGYTPQQQALEALRIGTPVAGMAQEGQLAGVELLGKTGLAGIESYLQGTELANALKLQQQEGMLEAVLGKKPTLQEQLMAQSLGMTPSQIGGLSSGGLLSSLGFGAAPTPSWLKSIGGFLGFGGSGGSSSTGGYTSASPIPSQIGQPIPQGINNLSNLFQSGGSSSTSGYTSASPVSTPIDTSFPELPEYTLGQFS